MTVMAVMNLPYACRTGQKLHGTRIKPLCAAWNAHGGRKVFSRTIL